MKFLTLDPVLATRLARLGHRLHHLATAPGRRRVYVLTGRDVLRSARQLRSPQRAR